MQYYYVYPVYSHVSLLYVAVHAGQSSAIDTTTTISTLVNHQKGAGNQGLKPTCSCCIHLKS